ncbi:SAICAR synthase-like protein [Decorospora gaudefroyi]|uniref:SAICAR synthase-like protein n=1 Tax=Decorospora gaudefroyi TaxID=184978 RepID=A0A6A5KR23_9PLEO|nr:SAICAR synthase-like protein [Decorospora gaudefroyi]
MSPAPTPGRTNAHSCHHRLLTPTLHAEGTAVHTVPLTAQFWSFLPARRYRYGSGYAVPRTTPNPTFTSHTSPSTRTLTLASHAASTPPPPRSGKAASLMSVTIHESQMMPAHAADSTDRPSFAHVHAQTTATPPARTPSDRTLPGRENREAYPHGSTAAMSAKLSNGAPVMQSVPNGRPTKPASIDKRLSHEEAVPRRSRGDYRDYMDSDSLKKKSQDTQRQSSERPSRDDGYFASVYSSKTKDRLCGSTTHVALGQMATLDGTQEACRDFDPPHLASVEALPTLPSSSSPSSSPPPQPPAEDATSPGLQVPNQAQAHRVSSPPAFNHSVPSPSQHPHRLQQRHTLEVPRLQTSRARETANNNTDDVISASGRFSPTTPHRRRGSMSLVRRTTRSVNSDVHLDEVAQDDDAARWAEHIRQKRASKRKRKEDEDDDRVVVGTKVDQHHVNWVTAYNMLTGIRFTVSRTNAKMDRDLTDADFDAKHKFSFDMYVPAGFPYNIKHLLEFSFTSTGNELTPSAKYDFKFKDYAPWVFRHLRATFKLDPADYLVSLTSKYILSELGSPGKSGSFFYFSRDYKYIIKTIHHAEHKFLRKILKDYYNHVQENPNTLLSQFYGLHRVKIPYGRKIHFVVMNNLFPPHRDIHRTFDLKGSTIGRDFKEDNLATNPRATLKDLNWLRRNQHLELGPSKKKQFIEQMEKDVKLLQRLHIMDYSMLIGIHDLEKGNEENLRDKTLKVFSPGGEETPEPQPNQLIRTPSKLESARKARELRQMVKTQKPIPMGQTSSKMPNELEDLNRNFFFYSDDGGFRATHEDDAPGEEIYYLGIIDCLTHYSLIKRMEHFIKGITNTESQISAIPPERYGDRFIKFISAVTKTKEAADREKQEEATNQLNELSLDGVNSNTLQRSSTDRVIQKAEHEADRSRRHGHSEEDVPNLHMRAVRSPSAERGEIGTTLPVVEEAGESSSVGGQSNRSASNTHRNSEQNLASPPPPPTGSSYLGRPPLLQPRSRSREQEGDHPPGRAPPTPPKDSATASSDGRPPTPPKDDYMSNRHSGPPTPPKEDKGRSLARASLDKELPRTPLETTICVN